MVGASGCTTEPRPVLPRVRALGLALLLLSPTLAHATFAPPQAPTRWATDTAGFISTEALRGLDAQLEAAQVQTGRHVILWIGQTTGGVPIEEWSARTFEAWGIGSERDDGVAIFVFARDRTLRIEVGYGLEGALPDVVAARIIREHAVPKLKAGDADAALDATVFAVLAVLDGRTLPPPSPVAPTAAPPSPAPAPPASPFEFLERQDRPIGPPTSVSASPDPPRRSHVSRNVTLIGGLGIFFMFLFVRLRDAKPTVYGSPSRRKRGDAAPRGTSSRSSSSSGSSSRSSSRSSSTSRSSSSSSSRSSSGSSYRGGGGRSGGGGASGSW